MYLVPFLIVEPELAVKETRVLTLLESFRGVPAGSYGLIEFYCPDPKCDCRRVLLNVAEENQPGEFVASIGYGFDREEETAGPFLDPLNPQSPYAEELLELLRLRILSDPSYVARLERHYHLVKQAASEPEHPAYERLQEAASASTSRAVHKALRRSRKQKPPGKRRKR